MTYVWDNYLDGSLENYNKVLSEKSLDDVINILNLDPNKTLESKSGRNLKESLWGELATIIYVWGQPSETTLKISPKNLLEHTQKIETKLLNAFKVIEEIESYTNSCKLLKTKEMIVADLIRDEALDHDFFKKEVNETKEYLEKFLEYTNRAKVDLKKKIKKRGVSKTSKNAHERLIFELCKVYKEYTGKQPISWNTGTDSFNSKQFTGDILYFLQGILSNSFYSYEITSDALQKKIYRMKDKEEYKDLWQDTKK